MEKGGERMEYWAHRGSPARTEFSSAEIDSEVRAANGEARSAAKLQARDNVARHSAAAGLNEVHGHDGVELRGWIFGGGARARLGERESEGEVE
jgi:hypothetical protein